MQFNGCVGPYSIVLTNTYLVGEHQINMRVHSNTIKHVRWHKIVPEVQRLECVAYDSEYVALLTVAKGKT